MRSIAKHSIALFLVLALLLGICPMQTFADSDMFTMSVGSANVVVGSTFSVDVSLSNNPGIAGLGVEIQFDGSALTLQDVVYNQEMGFTSYVPATMESPIWLYWHSDGETDVSFNGVFATLTFLVNEALTEDLETIVSPVVTIPQEIANTSDQSVPMRTESGTISIMRLRPGDINGDGETNVKDIIRFLQYRAHWDVWVSTGALDVNGDGDVNLKDVNRLGQYLARWNVEIFPKVGPISCSHSLVHYEAQDATCVSTGHAEYWKCSKCGKYYSDAGASTEITLASVTTPIDPNNHAHLEIIPAVPATSTSTGHTEGWSCDACGQSYLGEVIPITEPNTYSIVYRIALNDAYLASLEIQNPNSYTYTEGVGIPLLDELEVEGYIFEGWYDGQGSNANRVTSISATATGNMVLYARWTKEPYTVNFISNLYPIDPITYTVDTGAVLPSPSLSNYVFTGWTDDQGRLFDRTVIPVGTTGNLLLTANWISERNKAVTYTNIGAPIIYEDEENDVIYFIYEIGEMQNVPLYTIKDFGYISGDGVTKSETMEFEMQVSQADMASYSMAVSDATTRSTSWTLSSGWSDSTHIDEQWRSEHEISVDEATRRGTSETGNWNISNGKGGSYTSTSLSTNTTNKSNQVKLSNNNSSTESGKIAAGVDTELSASGFGVKAKVSTNLSVEDSHSSTRSNGMEIGGATETSSMTSNSASSTSSWNNTSSYGGSNSSYLDETTSYAIADTISTATGYGSTYVSNGNQNSTEGTVNVRQNSEEYTCSTTYSTIKKEKVQRSWTTQATKPGYHRWVVAGIMHVFGVVGYDMRTNSYFINTYSLMDDYTYEFEDYSYTSATYNDNQNGLISFEVPFYVADYVTNKTVYTNGLVINSETGIITRYEGEDTCVFIPECMPVYSFTDANNTAHYDIVKVTGIASDAFTGEWCIAKETIAAVSLPSAVDTIPANAFEGCTSLIGIVGGSITTIGEAAFNGCTAINCVAIDSKVTSLGKNAFVGAEKLLVNAANTSVIEAAVESGAKNIVIYTNHLEGNTAGLSGKTLVVPAGTESIEINGYQQEFVNLKLESNADKTVLNKMGFVSNSGMPLTISSPTVILNTVTVDSNNMCISLTAENTDLKLQGNNIITSGTQSTMLTRNVTLHQNVSNDEGKLTVSGDMLVFGTVSNTNMLARKGAEIKDDLTQEQYDLYAGGVVSVVFDSNGGTEVQQSVVEAFKGHAIGELPIPTKEYHVFNGWYTDPVNGDLVTSATQLDDDATLYAHWTPRTYLVTFNSNGSSDCFASITVFCDQEIGELPVPTRELYTFDGWFTELDGGEEITSSTVKSVAENMCLYAHWTANQHTVTFVPNGENVVLGENSRTVTCNSVIGTLPTATRDYYYFNGWYTELEGGTKFADSTVVTIDSDFSLYAHWTLNDMHDWTLASEVPEDAEIVEEKWTYSRTTETESTASSMDGWTMIGDYWTVYGSGTKTYASFPGTFDAGHWIYTSFDKTPFEGWNNGSTKREVSNTWAGYVYWHWAYNAAYANNTNRWISDRNQVAGSSRGLTNYGYNYFYAFTSSTNAPRLYDFTYTWGANAKYNSNAVTYNCSGCLPSGANTSPTSGLNNPRFLRFDYYTSSYTDSQHFYRYRLIEENLESTTAVLPENGISNVQHWVRYRDRVQVMMSGLDLLSIDGLVDTNLLLDDVLQGEEENGTDDITTTDDTNDPAEDESIDSPEEGGQTIIDDAEEPEDEVNEDTETNGSSEDGGQTNNDSVEEHEGEASADPETNAEVDPAEIIVDGD